MKIWMFEKDLGNHIILHLPKIAESTSGTHTGKVTTLGVKAVISRAIEIEYQVKLQD